MASFNVPRLPPTGTLFGPPTTDPASDVPQELKGIPFAPFAMSDPVGRIADWNNIVGQGTDERTRRQAQRPAAPTAFAGAAVGNAFGYTHAQDEASFSVVNNAQRPSDRTTRFSTRGAARSGTRGGRGGTKLGGAAPVYNTRAGAASRGGARGGRGGRTGGGGGGRWRDWDRPQRTREPSVNVRSAWQQVEEIEFNRLGKLSLNVRPGATLKQYGRLAEYNRTYDRTATTRTPQPLKPVDRTKFQLTTSEDEVLHKIAEDAPIFPPPNDDLPASAGSGVMATAEGPKPHRIFITDTILALLMCLPRSVYPWDLTMTVEDGNVYFDKRDGGSLDYVTVNENAPDPPLEPAELKDEKNEANATIAAATAAAAAKSDPINTPSSLALEATYVLHNFAFLAVNEKKEFKLADGPYPAPQSADDVDPPAAVGYRYRQFDLSSDAEDPIQLVVRTEVDAFLPPTGGSKKRQLVSIKTLNEFDSKAQGAGGAPDWRSRLDSQRGAVVATEIKNNAFKLARFAAQAILADSDVLKLGYISRANPKEAGRHMILATQTFKPRDLASQMNLSLANGWGIVRTLADLVRKEDGKYVLAKDPNKPVVNLYKVPNSYPDEEESEEEEEEEVGDEEDDY